MDHGWSQSHHSCILHNSSSASLLDVSLPSFASSQINFSVGFQSSQLVLAISLLISLLLLLPGSGISSSFHPPPSILHASCMRSHCSSILHPPPAPPRQYQYHSPNCSYPPPAPPIILLISLLLSPTLASYSHVLLFSCSPVLLLSAPLLPCSLLADHVHAKLLLIENSWLRRTCWSQTATCCCLELACWAPALLCVSIFLSLLSCWAPVLLLVSMFLFSTSSPS